MGSMHAHSGKKLQLKDRKFDCIVYIVICTCMLSHKQCQDVVNLPHLRIGGTVEWKKCFSMNFLRVLVNEGHGRVTIPEKQRNVNFLWTYCVASKVTTATIMMLSIFLSRN